MLAMSVITGLTVAGALVTGQGILVGLILTPVAWCAWFSVLGLVNLLASLFRGKRDVPRKRGAKSAPWTSNGLVIRWPQLLAGSVSLAAIIIVIAFVLQSSGTDRDGERLASTSEDAARADSEDDPLTRMLRSALESSRELESERTSSPDDDGQVSNRRNEVGMSESLTTGVGKPTEGQGVLGYLGLITVGAFFGSVITYMVTSRTLADVDLEAVELRRGMASADISDLIGQPDGICVFGPGKLLPQTEDWDFNEYDTAAQREVWNYGPFGAYREHHGHVTKYRLQVILVDDAVMGWKKSAQIEPLTEAGSGDN
jgi:hypothetical protein